VRTRERGKDELARPRGTRVHGDVVALRDHFDALFEVGKVEFGRDTLGVHVEREGDEVDVAGPLAVAEQATLDTVGTSHQAEFRCSDARAAVVVGVQRDDDVLAVLDVAAEVLDLHGRGATLQVRALPPSVQGGPLTWSA
jgi:hypothetical protein